MRGLILRIGPLCEVECCAILAESETDEKIIQEILDRIRILGKEELRNARDKTE